jgi:hypothetical protein
MPDARGYGPALRLIPHTGCFHTDHPRATSTAAVSAVAAAAVRG